VLDGFLALTARLAEEREIHLAHRPQHGEARLRGDPRGDADELLGPLELREADCRAGEVKRDAGPEDPIRPTIECVKRGLSDAHRRAQFAAAIQDAALEQDRRCLAESTLVERCPECGFPSGDLGSLVDPIETHQGGDLDDGNEDVDGRVAAPAVGLPRFSRPGQSAVVPLLQEVGECQRQGPPPFEIRNRPCAAGEAHQRTSRAVQVAAKDREIGEALGERDLRSRRHDQPRAFQFLCGTFGLTRAQQRFRAQDASPVRERRGKIDGGEPVERPACRFEIAPAKLFASEREERIARRSRVAAGDLAEDALERRRRRGRARRSMLAQHRQRVLRASAVHQRAALEQQRIAIAWRPAEGAARERLEDRPGGRLRWAHQRPDRGDHRRPQGDRIGLARDERMAREDDQGLGSAGAAHAVEIGVGERGPGSEQQKENGPRVRRQTVDGVAQPGHRVASRGERRCDGQLKRERVAARSEDRLVLQSSFAPALERIDQLPARGGIERRDFERCHSVLPGPGSQRDPIWIDGVAPCENDAR
jgi:hypothetical protein